MPIENKYVAIAAVAGFLLALWLTDGSMIAAFGVLALIAGIGWATRRLLRRRSPRQPGPLDQPDRGDTLWIVKCGLPR